MPTGCDAEPLRIVLRGAALPCMGCCPAGSIDATRPHGTIAAFGHRLPSNALRSAQKCRLLMALHSRTNQGRRPPLHVEHARGRVYPVVHQHTAHRHKLSQQQFDCLLRRNAPQN